ncbi:MAG TPA: molybdopterin cofactor-binding domain-containing protein [Streptosporangiaceae bacterium]|nr:molybdopterin cofactor-binding domain-containing protein [Streptosporangiaceae bacterium]
MLGTDQRVLVRTLGVAQRLLPAAKVVGVSVTVNVNGAERTAKPAPGQSLLELLRDDLGITSPKLGCGEGACGACTVLIGSRAVQACQVAAASIDGQRITTVEGLAEDGILHPVQQAWLELGAMQCGYCTAGWLTAVASLLAKNPHPDDERIDAELAGHACRCCAYPRIRRAVHRAAELMDHPELLEPAPSPAAGVRQFQPVPAESVQPESQRPESVQAEPAAPEPAAPWDLAHAEPEAFAAAMPEGLLAVVAETGERGWGGPDDAWVHVGADGIITAFTGKVEAGQGTRTALAMLVGEELAVTPGTVRMTMADTDTSPFDLGTFGSRSMPIAAPPLRAAAAAAFRLLRETAAARFGLPEQALTAGDGMLAGPDGAPSVSYGDLVAGQRRVERVSADEPVTPAASWQSAGRAARAAGASDVVAGAKRFPSDLRLPGMLHGRVLHSPAAGATLRQVGTAAAAALPGVTVVRDGSFVGVVAASERAATAALAAIDADWAEPAGPGPADLEVFFRSHLTPGSGRNIAAQEEAGDPQQALATAAVRLDATYHAAYVAHVPLEPRVALARWDGGRLTVWAATSTPFRARQELAAELGVEEAAVRVIVPDFGGGFGGKHGSVVAVEAARLARATGRPVKVQWSRADEFTAGYLRPAAVIDVSGGANPTGELIAWSLTNLHSGPAGLATPYRVPNQLTAYLPADGPLARGSYRALAATANNFARESHIDDLAAALGADPLAFRLRHLDDERLAAVLSAAAAEIGWGEPQPDGTGVGIALGTEKGGRVATAARVHVGPDRTLRLLRLVTAVDCGAIVHPDGLANQVEGAVVMGLGPALFEQIDFAGGRILNGSMTDYRVPRLADVPADLKVVLLDQPDQPSAGGGEAPIIAVAPAIGNAIFRACGTRLRSMPLAPGGRVPGSS